ncbi:MAG: hypothetical protein AB7N24_18920 [Dehalococcoidia bacterium]
MAELDSYALDVLDQILSERFPKVRALVAQVGMFGLSPAIRSELTDAFADELLATGFEAEWKPNARGGAIESLISLVCVEDDPRLTKYSAG